jgi:hypothetical protein
MIWEGELNLLEYLYAPVAQWIEHRTSNPMVVGPIPAGGAFYPFDPLDIRVVPG